VHFRLDYSLHQVEKHIQSITQQIQNGESGNQTGATGGSGGGSSYFGSTGGSGGSGVVIIRYADSYGAASSTTGSPTITVAGGYRVYQWTASGSITF
jgi:hypothetical protein